MKCSFCFLEMAAQDNKISSRIDELDALRGIAAILVVIFHCTMLHDAYTFTYGAAGVELFFIISGFVIFMTLNHVRSAKDFVINRFARLYPIYWFCVLLTFILMLFHNNMGNNTTATSPPYFQLAANMTMMQRYFGIQDLDGPYWSLAVELAFYAVMLLLYTYKAIKKTIHVLMAVMAVEFAVALATQNFPANGVLTGISVCSNYLYLIHFLPLFLSGVIFYHIYTEEGTTSRYIGILFCYFAQIAEYPNRHVDMFGLKPSGYAAELAVFYILFLLFVHKKAGFLVNRLTLFTGRISYALYLFHQYIILNFIIPYFDTKLKWPYFLTCLAAIVIVVIIAAVNTLYIDEPLRRKVKLLLTGNKKILR